MYVKTKNNIYNLENIKLMNSSVIGKIIKQSDKLEDLCDCYVVNHDITTDILVAKSWLKHARERGYNTDLYCAVWLSDGLKYVSRLLDNGEWEPL